MCVCVCVCVCARVLRVCFYASPAPKKPTTTPLLPHQGAAESTLNPDDPRPASADPDAAASAQPDLLNLSAGLQHHAHPGLGSRGLAADPAELGQLDLEEWCSGGALHLDLSPSQEADALVEAYRSLGLGADQDHRQERWPQGPAQESALGLKPRLRPPADLPGGAPVGWRSSAGKVRETCVCVCVC